MRGSTVFAGLAMFATLLVPSPAMAGNKKLEQLNSVLYGRVVDFTHNHDSDRRIWSATLQQKRDLYVYLPPGYDAGRPCCLVLWLHGAFGDEQIAFLLARLEMLDRLILAGLCPPTIVAIPDGTITGSSSILSKHSFFVNGQQGRFGDHLFEDVVPFIESQYSVRPEREARALVGVSAGGFGALSHGIKQRAKFGHVAALAPPANLRYGNVDADYFADFDPAKYRWRTEYRPQQTIGTFLGGVIRLKEGDFVAPVFGPREALIRNVAAVNPADLLFQENIAPEELDIFIHYPKHDNFNFDAQIESFQWLAASRGLHMTLVRDENGTHTIPYFQESMPSVWAWLGTRLPGGKYARSMRTPVLPVLRVSATVSETPARR